MSEQLRLGPEPEEVGPRISGGVTPAAHAPVARVLVETVHPHLAHEFDYGVPDSMAGEALPGVRVRVRFAGRLVSGFILDRVDTTDHVGELTALKNVVSPLPVLRPGLLELCRRVARRYAGTLPDVLRLAIPPRHARAEKALLSRPAGSDESGLQEACANIRRPDSAPEPGDPAPAAWLDFLETLAEWATSSRDTPNLQTPATPGPRAAYTVLPGSDPGTGWIRAGLQAAAAVLAAGRSVLWLVPDNRELDALVDRLGPLRDHTVKLSADQGPQARWTAWTTALTGRARFVVGTRTAAFAPLENLGLVMCFDDGNDSYLEQRAPYPHARTVLFERVRQTGAGLVMLDYARSVAVGQLVSSGWLGNVDLARPLRRAEAPIVLLPPDPHSMADLSNLPERAFFVMRTALGGGKHDEAVGPVLVQVPRTGYAPVIACDSCREVLRCPRCERPLAAAGPDGPFACRGCGLQVEHARCSHCGGTRMRNVAVGVDGVRRQLGRAFPGTRVVRSGGSNILPTVPPQPALVVATTGAEPYVDGGYAAAVLMDTLWPGPTLRATERSIARRMRALSLVRAGRLGGRAVVLDQDPAVVETLVRYAPDLWAEHESSERDQAHLPPAIRTIEATGDRAVCNELVAELERHGDPRVLEVREPEAWQRPPERDDDDSPQPTMVIGVPLAQGDALTAATADWIAARSLHRQPMPRVRVDDPDAL